MGYNESSDTVVSGSQDRTIMVHSVQTGNFEIFDVIWCRILGQLKKTLEGHGGWINQLIWEDNVLLSGSDDATVLLLKS